MYLSDFKNQNIRCKFEIRSFPCGRKSNILKDSLRAKKGLFFFSTLYIFYMLLRYLALTKNKANDVIKPSLVSSHGPPYSSSSIFWKFVKYMYKTPAFIRANLKIIKLWLFSHNQLPKTINEFILFTKLIHHHMKTGNEKKKAFHSKGQILLTNLLRSKE